ncbi:MAG: homoserine kinase [Flavobacteriales bacterium]
MKEVKVFCPASVANVSCGFDLMGFALKTIGDEMIVRKTRRTGVFIKHIEGYELPYEPELNVAGKAALSMLEKLNTTTGIEIEIYKKIHPGSGIGSSSASASGVVFAINELFDRPFSEKELIEFGMEGEFVASKSYHADNVAPALIGGMVFIRGYQPLDYFKIPVPQDLYCTIISPLITIKTLDARRVLKSKIHFKDAVTQCGNLGGLISGLYTSDYDLISRSLIDVLVEPQRAWLIPLFKELKQEGIKSSALGVGISGSGPSVFALSKGKTNAEKVAESFKKVYKNTSIDFNIYTSPINTEGSCIIHQK